jgi:magnesium transporter
MFRSIINRSKKAGLPPGTLFHTREKTENVKITLIEYDDTHYQEKEVAPEECFLAHHTAVTWINVDGVHQVDIVEKLGEHFSIHPLVLEDIVTAGQRPKVEDYGNYLYIVMKVISGDKEIYTEQISFILGETYLISFQEKESTISDTVKERIKKGTGRIRKMGADYLCYALIDTLVDDYFVILESLGEHIEDVEESLLTDPSPETLHSIQWLKKEMMGLRKSVWPLREVISTLERGESPLVTKTTTVYLRDVYDHTIQVIDTVETFRDMLSGMLDIYLSSISNRMNEVMKVLTIIATIFIPLTFVAGIYGMNFIYMPELQYRWGYPAVLVVMGIVGVVMVLYFRRKKWL